MAWLTYQWTNDCRERMKRLGYSGKPLAKAAGTQFQRRGTESGDVIYVIGYQNARAYLVGRMTVSIVRDREAEDGEMWDGCDIIEGIDGTPMRFSRTIPSKILEQLRFTDRKGKKVKGLAITDGELDEPQAIRSLRRITEASATLLDGCLIEG